MVEDSYTGFRRKGEERLISLHSKRTDKSRDRLALVKVKM